MSAQLFHDRRRRIEPGVQHICVDDGVAVVERLELVADGLEERAAVIAGFVSSERHVFQLPVHGAFETRQCVFERTHVEPEVADVCRDELVGHFAGLCS